ncbi:MAG: RluA family pseudouridine synthase [Verrucomicrobiota bacterium]|nr:RluA family pseudouridine synthase [Verrucomicrobiota bacterium]
MDHSETPTPIPPSIAQPDSPPAIVYPQDGTPFPLPQELKMATADLVVRKLFDVSWSKARDWIRQGRMQIDGRVVADARHLVNGRMLSFKMDGPSAAKKITGPLTEASIIALEHDFVVINKPAGLLTDPFNPEDDPTALSALRHVLAVKARARHRQNRSSAPPAPIQVVHRLDQDTSGLLVFALSTNGARALGQQFREHTIHRVYWALVHGEPKEQKVENHLIDNRGDGVRGSWESLPPESRGRQPRGDLAITHIKPIECFGHATLVECQIETGRTHQVRIHLSELGNPIIGDAVYIRNYTGARIAAPHQLLHSREIGFLHPKTAEELKWTCEPPAEFTSLLKKFRLAVKK